MDDCWRPTWRAAVEGLSVGENFQAERFMY